MKWEKRLKEMWGSERIQLSQVARKISRSSALRDLESEERTRAGANAMRRRCVGAIPKRSDLG